MWRHRHLERWKHIDNTSRMYTWSISKENRQGYMSQSRYAYVSLQKQITVKTEKSQITTRII